MAIKISQKDLATAPSNVESALWRFLRTRRGLLTFSAATAGVSFVLILALNLLAEWDYFFIDDPFIRSQDAWLWVAAWSCLLWLPLLLLLLDPLDSMAGGPRVALPLVTLCMLICLALSSVLFKQVFREAIGTARTTNGAFTLDSLGPIAAFFAFLALVFTVRVWNAANFARFHDRVMRARNGETFSARDAAFKRHNIDTDALAALLLTAGTILVLTFSFVAGTWDSQTRMGQSAGLLIASVAACVFALVIFVDVVTRHLSFLRPAIVRVSRGFSWLAAFYGLVDILLVRIGAEVAGATAQSSSVRYALIAGTQSSLAVMAWSLPDPLGLIPASVGFILALSVLRLWAWAEEDQNRAWLRKLSPNVSRRVVARDHGPDAILGLMFLLLLIPIALKQADAGQLFGQRFFDGADHSDPMPWIAFFSFELVKAVPIVDWADIYLEPGNFDTLSPTDPWGQHATFMARAIVDLVIIAAMLNIVSIFRRRRQQRELFSERYVNRLSLIAENEAFVEAYDRPKEKWFNGEGVDFRYYDNERLRELYASSRNARARAFIESIFEEAGTDVGAALRGFESLVRSHAPIYEIENAFENVRAEHLSGTATVFLDDLKFALVELRGRYGATTLKTKILDFAVELGATYRPPSEAALADLLAGVVFASSRDHFITTRLHAARLLTSVVPRVSDPDLVSELFAQLSTSSPTVFGRDTIVRESLRSVLHERLADLGR